MGRSQASKRVNPRGKQVQREAPPTGRLAFLRRRGVGLAGRLIMGAVFVISAAGKLTHPDAFVRAVASYEILPESLLALFGAAFPWLELVVGVLLLLGLFTRPAAWAAAGMMAFFIGLMLTAVAQGKAIDCGCFVGIIEETVGPATLIRDTILLLVVVPVLMAPAHSFGLDARYRLRRPSLSRNLTLAGVAAFLTVLVGGGIVVVYSAIQPAQAVSEEGWRIGSADAKAKIVVYSDFECPACGAVDPVLKRLVNEYGGSAAFVYKHFPLPQHEFARIGAEASEAAGEQGKFWEMHDAIFAAAGQLNQAQLRATAQKLDLDMVRYDDALASGRARKKVDADYAEGMRLGVNYTPYILVNGQVTSGITYQSLKAAIDRALSR